MPDNDMDQPFHHIPPTNVDPSRMLFCGGVTLAAAAIDVGGLNPRKAAVIFEFSRYDGTPCQPVVFIADDEQLRNLPHLVDQAVEAAIEARRMAAGE